MISLISQNGESLGQVTYAEAQRIALINRLSLVKLGDSSMFKLVDLGKQKYLNKKTRSRIRLATRVIKKHIDIKSNIDTRDLNIKFNAVLRFIKNGYRVTLMVRRLRLVTTGEVYNKFVSLIKDRVVELCVPFEGPVVTDAGDSMFYLFGDDPQAKAAQAKNQVSSKKEA
ncbi:MAG: hypothetical protein AAI978_00185 [Candidatus Hodgkinia cicadicola]